jgi:acyl-CoA synthetase (AMP-forming)/AMP-acid ligase II
VDLLVSQIFRNAARNVPGRAALHVNGEVWTFAQLDAAADRLGSALLERGVRPGDTILHSAALSADTVMLFAAAARIGAIYAPIDPTLSEGERRPYAELVQPRLMLEPNGLAAIVAELGDDPAEPVREHHDENAAHVLFFTSGSTGRAKGVPLTNRVSVLRSHAGAQPEPRGAAVCPFPLFHMAGWTIALQQWQARAAVVLPPKFAAEEIFAAIEEHRAERVYCIPAIWRRLLDHHAELRRAGARLPDLSSVRIADTGTSRTPPDLIQALTGLLPRARVRVFYGSTEAGLVACLEGEAVLQRPGRCGLPVQGVQVRLSATGELQVRGPAVFDGYFGGADTEALSSDGWLRTGDLAEIDDGGYVSIIGRTKEIIRSGGHTIVPSEIEAALADMPGVADLAVAGRADPDWGEIVCAAVVPRDGAAAPDLAQLRAYCASRLAPYKHPRQVVIVDHIPRTASTQQVNRVALRAQLADPHPVG